MNQEKDLIHYRCHKTVHAKPMKLGDYNQYRGWEMPDDEDAEDPGYFVLYNKGTEDEHVSWSPQHVFEDGYSEIS